MAGALGGIAQAAGAAATARSPILSALSGLGGGTTPNPFAGLLSPAQTTGQVAPITANVPSPMGIAEAAMAQSGTGQMMQGASRQPQAPVIQTTGQMDLYKQGIAGLESGGRYDAIGPRHPKMGRAIGKYQIMEANIGPWSQEALGRRLTTQEFMANPQLQDAVFKHKFGQYVQQYGPEGAAQAWLGGPGGVGKTGRKDVFGTSVGEYGQRFMASIGLGGTASAAASTSAVTAAGSQAVDYPTQMRTRMFGSSDEGYTPGPGEIRQQQLAQEIAGQSTGGGFGGGRGPQVQQAEMQEAGPTVDTGEQEVALKQQELAQQRTMPSQRAAQRREELRRKTRYQV